MSQLIETVIRAARRPAALLVPVALAAVTVAACGNDVSPSSVARVGDSQIEKSEFDHWLEAAARSQQAAVAPGGVQETAVPSPPEFTECVAAKQEQFGGQTGGVAAPETPSSEELSQQCQQEYDLLKEQVMQFLIQSEAIEQEAEERGVSLGDEEVRSQFEDLRQQSFPSDRQYEQFIESSGMTEDDLLHRVRLDLLIAEIREDVLADQGDVTDEEISAYYEESKEEPPIGQPEQRDVRVVVTETEEEADEARQALEDGDPWAEVAEERSIDSASADRGGRLTVQEGVEEGAFDEAVFSADEGELTGPVETELGWYVFEVTGVREAKTQSLEEARDAIIQIIQTEREQEALIEFQEEFEAEVREETICADEFVVVGCENGPDPEEVAPPGAVPPGGVPPGGAPPGAVPPGAAPPGAVPPGAAPQPTPAPEPGGGQGPGGGSDSEE